MKCCDESGAIVKKDTGTCPEDRPTDLSFSSLKHQEEQSYHARKINRVQDLMSEKQNTKKAMPVCGKNKNEDHDLRHQILIGKMVAFLREIQNCKGRLAIKKKLIFHCQTGVSFSAVMLLADIVLQELTDSLSPVKPVNLLEPLKIVRPKFLPDARYLKMVYQILSEYLGYNERFIP